MSLNTMSRDELLAQPEVLNIPANIMSLHSDEFIAQTITDLRAARAKAIADEAAAAEERRNWTAPEWLIHDPEHSEPGKRAYRTEDGYTARPGNNSGRGRRIDSYSGWHVRMVSGADTEHRTTLRDVVKAIEFDRTQPRNHRAR